DLLADSGEDSVRDSDVKRRMLSIEGDFDEAEYGFSKFSRFLSQATDDGVILVDKSENGNFQVSRGPGRSSAPVAKAPDAKSEEASKAGKADEVSKAGKADEAPKPSKKAPVSDSRTPSPQASTDAQSGRRLRPRQSKGRSGKDGPPPLLEGQMVGAVSTPSSKKSDEEKKGREPKAKDSGRGAAPKKDSGRKAAPKKSGGRKAAEKKPAARKKQPAGRGRGAARPSAPGLLDLEVLGLPTDRDSVIQYLSNSWKGVGKKTAESLVDEVGTNVFEVIHTDPDRVQEVLTPARAKKVLEGWEMDYERRTSE
ncbi:MAG: hypothetical protein EA352_09675, partial [Gemmatimonadales bacterium]